MTITAGDVADHESVELRGRHGAKARDDHGRSHTGFMTAALSSD